MGLKDIIFKWDKRLKNSSFWKEKENPEPIKEIKECYEILPGLKQELTKTSKNFSSTRDYHRKLFLNHMHNPKHCKEYKALGKLVLDLNLIDIAITKEFICGPTGKRGDRGFLLDSIAANLLPGFLRHELANQKQKTATDLVFINGGVVGLPSEYFRIVKGNKSKDKEERSFLD